MANLQAFFNELMLPRARLGRAPGLGTGRAAAGPGVQPTAPAEGLRALMGNLRTGPFPGSTPEREAAIGNQTRRLNANSPGRLFAGLFDQPAFQPQRSGFQWQPPTGGGLGGVGGDDGAGGAGGNDVTSVMRRLRDPNANFARNERGG